jgi:DNA-binding GntR family transcriptional regulator
MNGAHVSSGRSTVDFDSTIPYHRQAIDLISAMIHCSALIPGSQIPAELELCASYRVSRTAIRQVLGELEKEGVVTTRKGKGTPIAKPKIHTNSAWKPTGSYEDISYLDEDRPVEYCHAVHRGDQTRFEVRLARPEAPKRVAIQASLWPESE